MKDNTMKRRGFLRVIPQAAGALAVVLAGVPAVVQPETLKAEMPTVYSDDEDIRPVGRRLVNRVIDNR